MLRTERVAFYLQACWKLCRRYGVANIAVAHRLSDLSAQSDDGTATAKVARGLLADTQTRVAFHQAPGELAEARELLGLSAVATDMLPNLRKGEAIWRIGDHDAVVAHAIGAAEAEICNTDQALAV